MSQRQRKGRGGEVARWRGGEDTARARTVCENHQSDITTFPPESAGRPREARLFSSAAKIKRFRAEQIVMTVFAGANRNYRDWQTTKTGHCKSCELQSQENDHSSQGSRELTPTVLCNFCNLSN